MNKERLLELADIIEGAPYVPTGMPAERSPQSYVVGDGPLDGFNMASWQFETDCGTAGCIAGWVVALWGEKITLFPDWFRFVRLELGLKGTDANDFLHGLGSNRNKRISEITPAEAATAIRNLVAGDSPVAAWARATA